MNKHKLLTARVLLLTMILSVSIINLPLNTFSKTIWLVEDFNSYKTGEKTIANSQMRVATTVGGSFEVVDYPTSHNKSLLSETNSLETENGAYANIYLQLKSKGIVDMQFDTYLTELRCSTGISLRSPVNGEGGNICIISNQGLIIPYNDSEQSMAASQPVDINSWINLRFLFNTNTAKYDFYIDGKLRGSQLEMPKGIDFWKEHGLSECVIQRGGYRLVSKTYYDNIKVTIGDPLSEVEKPIMDEGNKGLTVWYGPADKSISKQNPPFFRWPAITLGDTYDLQLSKDPSMETIDYEFKDLVYNFHNIPHKLDVDVWYWRVRGKSVNGVSDWSNIKRVRIDKNATEFIVPTADQFTKQVRKDHPRIWTNSNDLERFRSLKNTTAKEFYEEIQARVDKTMNNPLPIEPVFSPPEGSKPGSDEYVTAQGDLRAYSDGTVNEMFEAAFAYLATGEEKYAKKSAKFIVEIAKWDMNGDTSYFVQDQVHRAIAYKSAIAYDWIYDFLTPMERELVLDMVKDRTLVMYNLLLKGYPLYKTPFDSHGWSAAGFIAIIAIATMDEIPQAKEWFEMIVPMYINIQPVWDGDEGGYSNGTAYWSYATTPFVSVVYDAIYTATGFNVYNRAKSKNEYLFPLYFTPNGAPTGAFGDEGYVPSWRDSTCVTFYHSMANIHKNPVAKWGALTRGVKPFNGEISYYSHLENEVEPIPPLDYQTAAMFETIGWVGMHSDLVDPQRVSLMFKSSSYGSYNHSHADQNSFIINAYGEPLAIDSGYYDYYHSEHGREYAYRTHAHNAITYDGLKGQYFNPRDNEGNVNSKGAITNFVTGKLFDSVTGNATEAYREMDKAKRHAIYIKPDKVIIVDDLKAKEKNPLSFAFNLHAVDPISADDKKAVITKGKAQLTAHMAYPENLTLTNYDKYVTVNGGEAPPGTRHKDKPNQYFVNYKTEEKKETIMATVLDIHKKEEQPKNVVTNKNRDCMEIVIDDEYKVYVRLKGEGEVTYNNITFDGAAVAVYKDNYMLVDGIKLLIDNKELITANNSSTVLVEGKRAHLYSSSDTKINLGLTYNVTSVINEKNVEMYSSSSSNYNSKTQSCKWSSNGNTFVIDVEKGGYNLFFNGETFIEPKEMSIRMEGTPINFINKPITENGTIYAPANELFKALRLKISENSEQLTTNFDGKQIVIIPNQNHIKVNEKQVDLGGTTKLINGVIYVPIRGLTNALDGTIGWHNETNTAYIYMWSKYNQIIDSSLFKKQ